VKNVVFILGAIRGIILEPNSRHLEPVEAFLGVPYASADRLHPPRAPDKWHGTKLADSFGPVCPQKHPDLSNRSVENANLTRD
jgi:neuroligin